MKYQTKDTFLLKTVAGESVLMARGREAIDFGGMIVFNETGLFMWKLLETGCTAEELAARLAEKYGISEEQTAADSQAFLQKCLSENLLDVAEG